MQAEHGPYRSVRRVMYAALVAAMVTGGWAAAEPRNPGEADADAKGEPAHKLTELLGGELRYRTHLSTDKPIYRGGETVYIRGVILDAGDHTPLRADNAAAAEIEIKGPKGETVAGGALTSADSVLGFKWDVPENQAGGEYTIRVTYPWQGFAPAERTFDVRQYRAPRLKTQIVFVRDGYGPGDTVNASVNINRAEGGAPTEAKITAVARVDGVEVHRGKVAIDDKGNASASFDLPKQIERGEGTLAFVIRDGGVVETAAKTIPILLQTVDLQMYPEGGDLVRGIASRVYLEATLPNGKPADLAGVVEEAPTNIDGKVDWTEVAEARTEHEGRGRFTLTPRPDRMYRLRITKPSGIDKTFDLPAVKERGVVLRAKREVYPAGEPIALRLDMLHETASKVTLRKQEKVVGEVAIDLPGQDDRVTWVEPSVKVPADVDGVLVATAYDKSGKPLAERLVFRAPASAVNLQVEADKQRYVPGGRVELTVRATDERGEPVEAVVGLTVADDSVLEMIDKREQAPRLPVMVFLEPEVKDLADAHVYLDPEHEQAELATDLLLGTQGWRRFALVNVAEFIEEHGDDAKRALALRHPDPRKARRSIVVDGRWVRFDEKGLLKLRNKDGGDDEEAEGLRPQEAKLIQEAQLAPGGEVRRFDRAGAAPMAAQMEGGEGGGEVEEVAAAAAPPERPAGDAGEAQAAAEDEDMAGQRQQLAEAAIAAARDIAADKLIAREPRRRQRRNDFAIVREFAYKVRPDRQPGQRIDFTETLYFHAGVKTDAETGEATVSFGLSDSVTGFRVMADAFTASGAVGSGGTLIESVEPFYIEPKMPLELTSGDTVDLPVAVVNGTDEALSEVRLNITTAEGIGVAMPERFAIGPDGRVRQVLRVDTRQYVGESAFTVAALAGPFGDRNTRTLSVKPLGFPAAIAHGGMLESDSRAVHTITIPDDRVAHSVKTDIRVMPSPVANMTSAMERLIREPHGCFEQTSSTIYPLAMAQQYFTTHQGVEPALIRRSAEILDRGYHRLVSFECEAGGFEWFGEDPAHEALTAYGLMEFTDMSKVMSVNEGMLGLTRDWLLNQRDGEGGFKRQRRALHTWITDPDCSNGYILWSLVSTGTDPSMLGEELDALHEAASRSDNSYVVALAANVMAEAGRKQAFDELLGRLGAMQHEDGYIEGATTSIVGSSGRSLTIEATALAQLAMLRDDKAAARVEKTHKWLAEQCEGGRYGSTQSTVLAIKAIVAYDEAQAAPKAEGALRLFVDGERVGPAVEFTPDAKEAMVLPDVGDRLTPGEHTIEIRMDDGGRMPYALSVDYHRVQPDSSDACKLRLSAKLNDAKLTEGEVTEARVSVSNAADETAKMPVAIIGVPGGLEVRHDQLKELRDAGTIAAYEVIGRDVVLYWRELAAGKTVELPLSLVAAVPGRYTAPASRAYEYYNDEHKRWQAPLAVKIEPR